MIILKINMIGSLQNASIDSVKDKHATSYTKWTRHFRIELAVQIKRLFLFLILAEQNKVFFRLVILFVFFNYFFSQDLSS